MQFGISRYAMVKLQDGNQETYIGIRLYDGKRIYNLDENEYNY